MEAIPLAGAEKKSRREGRSLIFIDETGVFLMPLVRRTWARRGQTPVLYEWRRGEKLSAISALTLSPQRRRLGLMWSLQRDNYNAKTLARFLRQVRRQAGRNVLVVWDRLKAHYAAAKRIRGSGITFAYLPAYAPELNPVEYVWSHSKAGTLANWAAEDTDEVEDVLHDTYAELNGEQRLLRGFFAAAGLKLGP